MPKLAKGKYWMNRRYPVASFSIIALVVLASVATAGQESAGWTAPKTPWGDPDVQGIWTNETITTFERPATFADKAVLTEEEARALELQNAELRAARDEIRAVDENRVVVAPLLPYLTSRAAPGGSNEFWKDPGSEVVETRQTSLVVDPPDGRIAVRHDAEATLDANRSRSTDSWKYMSVWDRCITRGVPGSLFPTAYNNAYQILQIPGYVVIRYEMIHDVRIIPLDGRRHIGSDIRLWMGDSRGRWEGNTLVVETTSYNNQGHMVTSNATSRRLKGIGVSEALRVVERFTRVDEHTLNWEATVEDPNVYTRPWTVAMPLKSKPEYQIYEYACHEGNWAVRNILSAGRAQEAAVEAAKSGSR